MEPSYEPVMLSGINKINFFITMIRKCEPQDFEQIFQIINDGASAYKGVIPADRWREPYMPQSELAAQISDGVEFWGFIEAEDSELSGVMGIQDKGDVTLIRHAYVRTAHRQKGVGTSLLKHLTSITSKRVLIGTWADAKWAIDFYVKHSFRVTTYHEKERLLRKYWKIPLRQIETSVVLVDSHWKDDDSP
jgi:GNAT superfamily N-acetyltransferase